MVSNQCSSNFKFYKVLSSRIGLDFLIPTSQLKYTDVIGFCMQFGNTFHYLDTIQ